MRQGQPDGPELRGWQVHGLLRDGPDQLQRRLVDLDVDDMSCGKCGDACGGNTACSHRACCAVGLIGCPGTNMRVDLLTDPKSCGECGMACANDLSCKGGVCS